MKDNEKKTNNTEENGVELTDEELSKVVGGLVVRHESQDVELRQVSAGMAE